MGKVFIICNQSNCSYNGNTECAYIPVKWVLLWNWSWRNKISSKISPWTIFTRKKYTMDYFNK